MVETTYDAIAQLAILFICVGGLFGFMLGMLVGYKKGSKDGEELGRADGKLEEAKLWGKQLSSLNSRLKCLK